MTFSKFVTLCLAIAFLNSCSNTKSTPEGSIDEAGASLDPSTAISMGNNVSVRAEPSAKGERLTALAIGEEVTWLDSIVTDTQGKVKYEYARIRLSDGTEGWAVGSYLFESDELGAILNPATIYSRPDFLTSTKKSFQPMDLVAYRLGSETAGPDGAWRKVTGRISGEKSFTTGWIVAGNIVSDANELLVAQLIYKANELKGHQRMDKIKSIASNPQFTQTKFLDQVKALTYTDPSGFLKPEFKDYYIGMINYYDSTGSSDFYQFDDNTEGVDLFNKTFKSFRYGEWRQNNHFYIWDFFYDFSTYAAAVEGYETRQHYRNYYEISDRVEAMEKLSGIKVFDSFDEGYSDFNHVNDDFVRWASSNLLPKPDDDFLGVAAGKVYDVVFKENARYTWKTWRQLTYQFDMDLAATNYEQGMGHTNFDAFAYLKSELRGTSLDPVIAGVFIRRKMDGSYDEVVYAMNKAMTLYDGDWMEEQKGVEPWSYFADVEEEEEYYEEEYYEEEYYEEEGE